MIIREHEPLHRHTTLRAGGPARFFIDATSPDGLLEAIRFAQSRRLPTLVLGDGSNVLVGDGGFEGVVIHVATRGIQTANLTGGKVQMIAEAGEPWDRLVVWAVERGLSGLENMSLIPGTVGAAVVGNIGAYGAEVSDALDWAEALDYRTGVTRQFASAECEFAYRHSFFKTARGRHLVITRAAFSLSQETSLNLRYKELTERLATTTVTTPTLAEVREAVISIRRGKLPDPAQLGTAGSFFKNPVVSQAEYQALLQRYPGLPGHIEDDHRIKLPLGWILDRICGLKGVRSGHVGTHAQQALVIVNEGGTASEIEAFANSVAGKVKDATGLDVEWEVEKVGCP
jgi:UDP-N-acetylmuramate dehydrogenase